MPKMKKYLVSFATRGFYKSQKKLNVSALKFGVDEVKSYNRKMLKKTSFYKENKVILDRRERAGCALWKPYIILDTMSQIDYGDVLIYSDAGIEIIRSLSPLIKICCEQNGILLFRVHGCPNKIWTRRNCFVLMDCDSERYWDAEQCMGGFQIYIKNERSICFLEEYLSYARRIRINIDSPNICGLGNLPGFKAHRYQSIVSLLAIKHNIEVFRNPSQHGNYMKMKEFREPGEFLTVPYSQSPCTNSPYHTVLNVHREGGILYKIRKHRIYRKQISGKQQFLT